MTSKAGRNETSKIGVSFVRCHYIGIREITVFRSVKR